MKSRESRSEGDYPDSSSESPPRLSRAQEPLPGQSREILGSAKPGPTVIGDILPHREPESRVDCVVLTA